MTFWLKLLLDQNHHFDQTPLTCLVYCPIWALPMSISMKHGQWTGWKWPVSNSNAHLVYDSAQCTAWIYYNKACTCQNTKQTAPHCNLLMQPHLPNDLSLPSSHCLLWIFLSCYLSVRANSCHLADGWWQNLWINVKRLQLLSSVSKNTRNWVLHIVLTMHNTLWGEEEMVQCRGDTLQCSAQRCTPSLTLH